MKVKQHTFKQPVGHWRNQRGNKKTPEMKENGNTMFQNLWDAAKVNLRGSL